VWQIFIFFYYSGGLAYMLQWQIGYKPQFTFFFTMFVVKAASVTSHGHVCCYNISG